MIIRSNSPLLGKKVYVNCQKSWHIFSRYSKVHPPVYRSIHSELRFMKRGWNTFSPCPPCSHRNNDARKIFLFPLFYYIRACTLHVSIYIHTHTHAYIFLLLFFLLRTSTPSEKAHAGTEGKGRIARSWNVGWRLIYTARGKSTKRNGSWLPRHDTL